MKRIFVFLCLGLSAMACSEDDKQPVAGPEPGELRFDTTTCVTELRRDTADFAHLQLDFCLPEKIGSVEVKTRDGRTLKTWEEYAGLTRLVFDYPADISDLFADTTVAYTLSVSDLQGTSYHKTFVFNIRPFSVPQILLPDGRELLTDLAVYKIRARLTTGAKPIARVRLVFEGKEQDITPPQPGATEYVLDHQLPLISYKEYQAELQVEDTDGRQSTRELTITKIPAMEKPVRIHCKGEREFNITFGFDADNRLESIDMSGLYRYRLYYGDLAHGTAGIVVRIERHSYDEEEEPVVYAYQYTGQQRLQTLTVTSGEEQLVQLTDFRYELSRLSGFSVDGRPVSGIAYEDLKTLGKPVSEIWAVPFSEMQESSRIKAAAFWTVKIPTYLDILPVPVFYDYDVNTPFQDLFLSPYLHLQHVSYAEPAVVTDTYSYETDSRGRLAVLARTSASQDGRGGYTYRFIYSDSPEAEK